MTRTAWMVAALVVVGCGPPPAAPKGEGKAERDDGAQKKQEPKADVEGVQVVAQLSDVYATDAVRWRDRYAGRRVVLHLSPPWEVKRRGERFYTLQEYQDGARSRGVPIYLTDESAERLSRIIQGEEKLQAGHVLRVKALIDPKEFAFGEGELSVVKER